MSKKYRGVLGNWDVTSEEILEAMRAGVRTALREHKRQGVPTITTRDGKIVRWAPEEIVVPDEPPDDDEAPAAKRIGAQTDQTRE